MSLWNTWIMDNWQLLLKRKHLPVPTWLPHRALSGFKAFTMSTPAGQCRDWSIPPPDGSRIHVHEFPDGRLVAHRDRFDPDRGIVHAAAHFFSETEVGLTAAVRRLAAASARGHADASTRRRSRESVSWAREPVAPPASLRPGWRPLGPIRGPRPRRRGGLGLGRACSLAFGDGSLLQPRRAARRGERRTECGGRYHPPRGAFKVGDSTHTGTASVQGAQKRSGSATRRRALGRACLLSSKRPPNRVANPANKESEER
jgi:hypothetical protein